MDILGVSVLFHNRFGDVVEHLGFDFLAPLTLGVAIPPRGNTPLIFGQGREFGAAEHLVVLRLYDQMSLAPGSVGTGNTKPSDGYAIGNAKIFHLPPL